MNSDKEINKELTTITKGAGFSFLGKTFRRVARFFIAALLTRALGASLFGIYSLGKTILNLVSKVATLGLSQGSLKFISAFYGKDDERRVKGTIFTSLIFTALAGTLVGVLIFLFSERIALAFNKELLVQPLKAFAIAVPFLSLLTVLGAATRGFKTTKYEVLGKMVIRDATQLFLVICFYFLGYELLGMIGAYIFSILSGTLYLLYALWKLFPELTIKKITPEYQRKKLLSTSIPLMYIGVLGFFISWTDILMLGYFVPSAKVGIYKVVVAVGNLVGIFLGSFLSIFRPVISEYYHQEKHGELNDIFKTAARWTFILSFPIFLLIFISASDILRLFGSDFVRGSQPLLILASAQLFKVFTFGTGAILDMTVYQKLNAFISGMGVIINVALNYLFIAYLDMGILGAAIATTIALISINSLRTLLAFLKLKLFPFSKKTLKLGITCGLGALIPMLIRNNLLTSIHYLLRLVATGFILGIIFVAVIFLFGIEEKDRFIIRKIKNKVS